MKGQKKLVLLVTVAILVFFGFNSIVVSTPDDVTVSFVGNSTAVISNGTIGNATSDGDLSGGRIFTINVTGNTQNARWKAFVGNASGKLSLDDSNGKTIYDWSLSTITGEVYATRHADTINWTGINCALSNHTEYENTNLSHTSPDDNITATFVTQDNQAMTVGTVTITANTCRTINPYINSTDPGETTDNFEEIILHDQGNNSLNMTDQNNFGKIVYAQNLESDLPGYENTSSYDFQLIVPEVGSVGFASSTAYYFYLELS